MKTWQEKAGRRKMEGGQKEGRQFGRKKRVLFENGIFLLQRRRRRQFRLFKRQKAAKRHTHNA